MSLCCSIRSLRYKFYKLTGHHSISVEVFTPSLCQEDVCLIQQQDASPSIRECEVRLQRKFNGLGGRTEVS